MSSARGMTTDVRTDCNVPSVPKVERHHLKVITKLRKYELFIAKPNFKLKFVNLIKTGTQV